MGGWIYDDYQVLATLRDFATHDIKDEKTKNAGNKLAVSGKATEVKMVKVLKNSMLHNLQTVRQASADGETPDTADTKADGYHEEMPMTPKSGDIDTKDAVDGDDMKVTV